MKQAIITVQLLIYVSKPKNTWMQSLARQITRKTTLSGLKVYNESDLSLFFLLLQTMCIQREFPFCAAKICFSFSIHTYIYKFDSMNWLSTSIFYSVYRYVSLSFFCMQKKVSRHCQIIADRHRHHCLPLLSLCFSSLLIHVEYNDDQFCVLQAVRRTRRD